MTGKPFITQLKVGAIITPNTPRVPCVVLECMNDHEATFVLNALEDFIRQLKNHVDGVQEEN